MNRSQKSEVRSQKFEGGYTLIELLAVTAIIVIVSGLIAGILYSTLRGGNKSKVTNDIAQNGNYVLSVFTNTVIASDYIESIGGAEVVDCTDVPSGSSITMHQASGESITFICASDAISSASGSLTTPLVDTNSLRVEEASCSFSCRQENFDPYAIPIISASFTLSQKQQDTQSENTGSASFSTSVSMRNFNPK